MSPTRKLALIAAICADADPTRGTPDLTPREALTKIRELVIDETPPPRRILPAREGWELEWIQTSLERTAAEARAQGIAGVDVKIEPLLDGTEDHA